MRKLDGLFWYQQPAGLRGYFLKVQGKKFRFFDGDPTYYAFKEEWRVHMTPANSYMELFYGQANKVSR